MKIQIFWDVTPCRLLTTTDVSKRIDAFILSVKESCNIGLLDAADPKDKGVITFRNVSNYLLFDKLNLQR